MNSIKKRKFKAPLFTSAISLVLITATPPSIAKTKLTQEQCAGIVKAGMNDCASSEHACAGLNGEDGYESDWLWLPAGTCKKISGAHVITPKTKKKV